MPFVEVSENRLGSICLFGFKVLEESDDYYLVEDSRGKEIIVKKSRPFLWFEEEDMGDAIQLGAKSIIINPK